MSVTMASVYIAVHLFGTATKQTSEQKFDNWNQCVSSLEIHESKFRNKPNFQITLDRERGYLAISDHREKTVETHQCSKE